MFKSAAPSLLLATPTLLDPNFFQTVLLLFHHSEEGAMGLVINRPTDQVLGELLDGTEFPIADLEERFTEQRVLVGGPVNTHAGWMIFEGADETGQSIEVESGLDVTGSMDVFKAVLSDAGTTRMKFLVGYAGWGPGQLDSEMDAGAWLPAPLDRETLFETPYEDRWRRAFGSIGIDPSMWSMEQGEG